MQIGSFPMPTLVNKSEHQDPFMSNIVVIVALTIILRSFCESEILPFSAHLQIRVRDLFFFCL